uniref:Retrotransposon gag domain-containing protein n=1 Tax=Brassica campestris TaxID=3711 RepID=M4DXT9_BRACM
MNFSNRRFLGVSICEYTTLEEDSSAMKKHPEPNPIIGVKRISSAFQKGQDHEKWSMNFEVMIQSPKPAKPVLYLPQLEPNRFNQLQTRHWRPADHFNQSVGIPEVPSWTITHRIRRILEEVIKLTRSYLWKDWTIFWFNPFQPNQLRPENIQTKPRLSEDIIGVYNLILIISPTRSSFWSIHQASIVHLANPDFQPATFGIRAQVPESGSSWPDDYLSWEITIDDLFSYNGVPKKKKSEPCHQTTHRKCIQMVERCRWCTMEESKTWKDIKQAMIRKYVSSLPSPEIREKYPWRFSSHVSKEAKRVVPQQGHRSLIHQDQIRPNQRSTVLYDQYQPYEVPKTMEKKNFVSQDTLARHKEKSVKSIFQEKAKKDTISTSLLRSKVIHDLSPRDKEIINQNKEEPSSQDKKMVQDTKLSMLLKEAKPIIKVSHQGKCLTPPRDTSTDVGVLDVWSKNESYMLTEVPRKEQDHKLSHKPPHKWKPKSEQWIVQIPRPMFLYHGVPKKEKLSHAIKQLTGSAYKWWKCVDGAQWKSQKEAIKTWEDLKEVMIRKYVSSLPSPEIRERFQIKNQTEVDLWGEGDGGCNLSEFLWLEVVRWLMAELTCYGNFEAKLCREIPETGSPSRRISSLSPHAVSPSFLSTRRVSLLTISLSPGRLSLYLLAVSSREWWWWPCGVVDLRSHLSYLLFSDPDPG